MPKKEWVSYRDIIKTFENFFMHYGYKKTTVDEVANELRISKKTMYYYIRSKYDAYMYIVHKLAKSKKNEYHEAIANISNCQEKIKTLTVMFFQHVRSLNSSINNADYDFELKNRNTFLEDTYSKAYYDTLNDVLSAGKKNNEIGNITISFTLKIINAIISQTLPIIKTSDNNKMEPEIVRAIKKIVE